MKILIDYTYKRDYFIQREKYLIIVAIYCLRLCYFSMLKKLKKNFIKQANRLKTKSELTKNLEKLKMNLASVF